MPATVPFHDSQHKWYSIQSCRCEVSRIGQDDVPVESSEFLRLRGLQNLPIHRLADADWVGDASLFTEKQERTEKHATCYDLTNLCHVSPNWEVMVHGSDGATEVIYAAGLQEHACLQPCLHEMIILCDHSLPCFTEL